MQKKPFAGILFAMALIAPWAAATHADAYKPPHTRFGQPDLQGIWTSSSLTRLERPPIFNALVAGEAQARAAPPLLPPDDVGNAESEWFDPGITLARINGQFRTSWIVDPANGRLPFSQAGRKKMQATAPSYDGPENRPLNERCLNAGAGPPMLNGLYNNNWQIVQTPDHVAIFLENTHEMRIVRLKDRTHAPAAVHPWMGDSIGWWEGDTLIIETTNFSPSQSRRRGGLADLYVSSDAKVTERLTRVSPTELLYRYEVDDPATYTQIWRGEMPATATKGPIYEYACHEGNYSLPGILAGARAEEREARRSPASPQ